MNEYDFEHDYPFPCVTDIPAGCSFNNHDMISSECRLAKLWLIAFTLYRFKTNDLTIFMGGVWMAPHAVNYILCVVWYIQISGWQYDEYSASVVKVS